MTGDTFKHALSRVGLSLNSCGPFLGFSTRQAFRIAAGKYDAPRSAALLLKLMAKFKLSREQVEELK